MPDPIVPTPDPTGNPTPPEGAPGSPAAVEITPPAGFVPQADFEREQARARTFQGERDRLAAQLATPTPPAVPAAPASISGFDPTELRRQMLRDNALLNAARDLQSRFPEADRALFGPDKLLNYGSVEAFEYAVKDSHDAAAARFAARDAETEARIRAEFVAKYGPIAGDSSPASPPTPGADPTPEALARMTDAELDALEVRSPGTYARVLMNASR